MGDRAGVKRRGVQRPPTDGEFCGARSGAAERPLVRASESVGKELNV